MKTLVEYRVVGNGKHFKLEVRGWGWNRVLVDWCKDEAGVHQPTGCLINSPIYGSTIFESEESAVTTAAKLWGECGQRVREWRTV